MITKFIRLGGPGTLCVSAVGNAAGGHENSGLYGRCWWWSGGGNGYNNATGGAMDTKCTIRREWLFRI